jgi:hypothetical protein
LNPNTIWSDEGIFEEDSFAERSQKGIEHGGAEETVGLTAAK